MVTINALFRMIVLAKRQGKGKLGNGVILSRLIGTLSDLGDDSAEIQRRLVITPDNIALNRYADKLIQNQMHFPFPNEPYGIPIQHFQSIVLASNSGSAGYSHYLERMYRFCKDVLNTEKIPSLLEGLLEQLHADTSVQSIFYNRQNTPKSALYGTPAHPRRLCMEALLIGILYHTLMSGATENARGIALPYPQDLSWTFAYFVGDTNAYIFSQDENEITQYIAEKMHIPLKERLTLTTSRRAPDLSSYQSLQISDGEALLSGTELLKITESKFFLRGAGGIGKSTLLSALQGENRILLHLHCYKKEIREQLLPDTFCWILVQILLQYYFGGAYPTFESCVACEGMDSVLCSLTELHTLLQSPEPSPVYTIMLDGINEIPPGLLPAFVNELIYATVQWQNVRWLISGRAVPDTHVFSGFRIVELLGIPTKTRDTLLTEAGCMPTDIRLLELLRSPMFLRLYLQSQSTRTAIQTRGAILDAFFLHLYDKPTLMSFLVRYAIPIAAKMMLQTTEQALTRADLIDAADAAFSLYLDNTRIYQNRIVPQHFLREELQHERQQFDIVELLVKRFGFLETDNNSQLRFTHQYFRDYFAARHYVNLMEIITQCFDPRQLDDVQALFDEWRLGHIWFAGEDADVIYSLIGELCGDYRNIPDSDDFVYRRTVLDDMLDFARELDHFRLTENMIRIMHLSRNGIVCGVDFSGLNLPFTMPEETYFSRNGDDPCDFRDTNVLGIFASSIPEDTNAQNRGDTVFPPANCEQYYLGCDFTGAHFFPIEENREILLRYGAVQYD